MNYESAKPSQDHLRQRPAFSLIELVVVVLIIGVLSAMVVPRVSNAGRDAQAKALSATLAIVRTAMDLYLADHGQYPGIDPDKGKADGYVFVEQLMLHSDKLGNTKDTHEDPFIYGPYLRQPFPTNPLNDLDIVYVKKKGKASVPKKTSAGWVAVVSNGRFGINASDKDLKALGVTDGKERHDMLGK